MLDLIVKTGIADAIANKLGVLKGNKNAVAETIENNVRKKIIKEHLNDPAFYANMSALLDEIIAARKAKAIEYEEYLKRIVEVATRVEAGQAEGTSEKLDTPANGRYITTWARTKNWPCGSTMPSKMFGRTARATFRLGSR